MDDDMSQDEKDREEVDGGQRGRPGRRSVGERTQAVMELLAGKATIDQLARRSGVRSETIEGWREDALAGISEALRRGSGKTARESDLERENRDLKAAVTQLSIEGAILTRAVESRPTVPARSRR